MFLGLASMDGDRLPMTFVTRLELQSGDRNTLDTVVEEIKERLTRKGVDHRGPHAAPSRRVRAPQYRNLDPGDKFDDWEYSVYYRTIEIHGSEHIARELGHRPFPDSVHVEIEVEQKQSLGS